MDLIGGALPSNRLGGRAGAWTRATNYASLLQFCVRTIGGMRQTRAGKLAVIAPGGGYGPDGPLLMFAGQAVKSRGGITQAISWNILNAPDFGQQRQRVISQVETVIADLTTATGAAPLVIGKSLGSLGAPVVADRGLPAVWFTPLLTNEETAAALRRATTPALLIGGTADEFWDGKLARSLSPHVIEIPDADHGMFVPGPLAASAAVLGEVITAVEHFLDTVVWP